MLHASRLRRSQGDVVTRVLRSDWSNRSFCLRLVGDLRPDRHSYQLAVANFRQIVSSLAIFRIFERDAHVHGGGVSSSAGSVWVSPYNGWSGLVGLIRQNTSAQHGSDPAVSKAGFPIHLCAPPAHSAQHCSVGRSSIRGYATSFLVTASSYPSEWQFSRSAKQWPATPANPAYWQPFKTPQRQWDSGYEAQRITNEAGCTKWTEARWRDGKRGQQMESVGIVQGVQHHRTTRTPDSRSSGALSYALSSICSLPSNLMTFICVYRVMEMPPFTVI